MILSFPCSENNQKSAAVLGHGDDGIVPIFWAENQPCSLDLFALFFSVKDVNNTGQNFLVQKKQSLCSID